MNDVKISQKQTAFLCYLLGPISGLLIFYLYAKKDAFVRFHALQSLLLSAVYFAVCGFLVAISISFPVIVMTFFPIINMVVFVFWVFLMYKAYSGEKYLFPLIGDAVDRLTSKFEE